MCEVLILYIVFVYLFIVLYCLVSIYVKNINGIDEYIYCWVKQFFGKLLGMLFLRILVKIDLDIDLLDIIKEMRYFWILLFLVNVIKINYLVYM